MWSRRSFGQALVGAFSWLIGGRAKAATQEWQVRDISNPRWVGPIADSYMRYMMTPHHERITYPLATGEPDFGYVPDERDTANAYAQVLRDRAMQPIVCSLHRPTIAERREATRKAWREAVIQHNGPKSS